MIRNVLLSLVITLLFLETTTASEINLTLNADIAIPEVTSTERAVLDVGSELETIEVIATPFS